MTPFEQAFEAYKAKFPHTFGWRTKEQCFAAGWDAALKEAEKTALDVIDRAVARSTGSTTEHHQEKS
jgi:hypothetical protein